jgi:hypothetical protein
VVVTTLPGPAKVAHATALPAYDAALVFLVNRTNPGNWWVR